MARTKVASVEYVVTLVIGIDLIQAPGSTLLDPDGELMRHVDDSIVALEHRWPHDCGVELDVTRSEATYFVAVDTGDETRAISQARGLLSIAIHAAGGATPHRPFPRDADWSVRLLAARAAPTTNRERAGLTSAEAGAPQTPSELSGLCEANHASASSQSSL